MFAPADTILAVFCRCHDVAEIGGKSMKLLRIREVMARSGIRSKSTIYRLVKAGRFPSPIKPTPGISAWDAEEVDEWLEACARQRETGNDRGDRSAA